MFNGIKKSKKHRELPLFWHLSAVYQGTMLDTDVSSLLIHSAYWGLLVDFIRSRMTSARSSACFTRRCFAVAVLSVFISSFIFAHDRK